MKTVENKKDSVTENITCKYGKWNWKFKYSKWQIPGSNIKIDTDNITNTANKFPTIIASRWPKYIMKKHQTKSQGKLETKISANQSYKLN